MPIPTFSTLLPRCCAARCCAAFSGLVRTGPDGRGRIRVKRGKRVAAALVAALAIAPASAQQAPAVVDGELWLRSTPEVRKAYLVGAANMIALETAYSKKKGTPPPVAGTMASQALQGLTLDQVSNRITRWYEGHPGRRNLPVLGVVWVDMVGQGAGAK